MRANKARAINCLIHNRLVNQENLWILYFLMCGDLLQLRLDEILIMRFLSMIIANSRGFTFYAINPRSSNVFMTFSNLSRDNLIVKFLLCRLIGVENTKPSIRSLSVLGSFIRSLALTRTSRTALLNASTITSSRLGYPSLLMPLCH